MHNNTVLKPLINVLWSGSWAFFEPTPLYIHTLCPIGLLGETGTRLNWTSAGRFVGVHVVLRETKVKLANVFFKPVFISFCTESTFVVKSILKCVMTTETHFYSF